MVPGQYNENNIIKKRQRRRGNEGKMKFKDMPYERVDLEKTEKEFRQIIQEFKEAKSGQEQFAVHQKYYEFTKRISTNITIASIRHDIDTTDKFYDEEQSHNDQILPVISN